MMLCKKNSAAKAIAIQSSALPFDAVKSAMQSSNAKHKSAMEYTQHADGLQIVTIQFKPSPFNAFLNAKQLHAEQCRIIRRDLA